MTTKIDDQILRLVKEIEEDEKAIRTLQETFSYAVTERSKSKIMQEIDLFERSLERKLLLLKILK